MPLQIVPLYASLLALLFVLLSVRVIGTRRRWRVALGDGEIPALRRAMRVQANFAEYVPLGLILITFVELRSAPGLLVHLLGVLLLTGRLIHAYGVSGENENFRFRTAGMMLTFATLIAAALANLGLGLF